MSARSGNRLMLVAGALGAIAATYDYVAPSTGLDATGGVQLVIASSVLMEFGAIMTMLLKRGILAGIFLVLLLLDVIGTGAAGYFLESPMIMGAMALAALGWILRVTGRTA